MSKKKSTLAFIKEMFKDKLDEEVINLVLTENNYNVNETVNQLSKITDSANSKPNGVTFSSNNDFGGIDPVDTPLPNMQHYLTPNGKECNTEQLNLSPFVPSGPLSIPLGNNPTLGTAPEAMIPGYPAMGNKSPFVSQKQPTEPNAQKLGDAFNENETYVSDDDIDDHIDSIDPIDSTSTKKNYKNFANVSDISNRERNVSHGIRNKSGDSESILRKNVNDKYSHVNGKTFKGNNPQQKQASKHNSNKTNGPNPFATQLRFPPNQSPYFASQARYFPSFVSSTFPHPFVQNMGNMPPGQYHRLPSNPHVPFPHPVPSRAMALGNKRLNHSVPMNTMPLGYKAPNHSAPAKASQSTMTCASGDVKASKHPTLTSNITSNPATTTSKLPNQTTSPTSTNGCIKNSNPIQPPSKTQDDKAPKNSKPPTPGSKNPDYQVPTKISGTYCAKGSYGTHAAAMVNTSKGFDHSRQTMPTNSSKRPDCLVPTTTSGTYGPKGSFAAQAAAMVTTSKGFDSSSKTQPTHTSKGPDPMAQTKNTAYANKGSNNMERRPGKSQTKKQVTSKVPPKEEKRLIILRGLPGSGKSYLASQLSGNNGLVLSTDHYFERHNSKYYFDPIELSAAHEWNQNRAKTFMEAGLTPLIIDNTNVQSWEMRPYVLIGLKCGYKIDIREPDTQWKWNIKELERKNVHGVPAMTLQKMLERYEKNITVDSIAKSSPISSITPKPNSKEENGNVAKSEKDNKPDSSSNTNRKINENEKLPKAGGKSGLGNNKKTASRTQTKRAANKTRKAISLSANFSASQRSAGNGNAKKEDKEGVKNQSNDDKTSDIIRSDSEAGEHSDSNFDAAVTSKPEQSDPIGPVSSIDASVNKQKISDKEVNVNSENMLDIQVNSSCEDITSFGNTRSDVSENEEIDITTSRQTPSNVPLSSEARFVDTHENDDSKRKFGVDGRSTDETPPPNYGKDIPEVVPDNISLNTDDAKLVNRSDIQDDFLNQKILSDSKEASSEENISRQLYLQSLRKGDMVYVHPDYESFRTRCASPKEQSDSFSCENQDKSLVYHSDDDIEISDKDENASRPFFSCSNTDEQPEATENSFKSDEQFLSQNNVPFDDLLDMARTEDAVVDVQIEGGKVNEEGVFGKHADLTIESSSPYFNALKDENQRMNTVVDPMSNPINSNVNHSSFLNGEQQNTLNSEVGRHTGITLQNLSSDSLNTKDNAQRNQPSDDQLENSVKKSLTNRVVDLNSEIGSDSKSDETNANEFGMCKVNVTSCKVHKKDTDTTNNNSHIINHDPVNTCEDISNPLVNLSSVVQSNVNDLERTEHEEVRIQNTSSVVEFAEVQQHIEALDDPVNDEATTNVKEVSFEKKTTIKSDSVDSSIPFLKDCFPQTEIDLLKSFLSDCNGDLIKTVDRLLEHNKKYYQSDTPEDQDDISGETSKDVNDVDSAHHSSVPPAEYSFVSPNVNGERETASRSFYTPEDTRSLYDRINVETPTSNTPNKSKAVSVDSLQLTLDPALAMQLLEMFGAFSGVSGKDSLSESARSIRIDKDLAKTLYTKWRKTVQAKTKAKKAEESKKSSPGSARRKYKTPPRQFYLPDPVEIKPPKSVAYQPEPVSLSEIMDEQLAIHVSQSDQVIEKRYLEEQLDLSTKLKRSRLHGMFPNVDPVALNEIFQANNYDLDTTIMLVQSSVGLPFTGNATDINQGPSFTISQSSRQNEVQQDNSTDLQTDVDGNFQSFVDPSYLDYRAEAQTHFELRSECIKKAAIAYSKKQGELAKIYADQARQHGEKIKEANRRAAEKILESRNHDLLHSNSLDLHDLHVNEAIHILDNVLEERRKERRTSTSRRSPSYLEVITGRGNRSRDGKPRIKPAVIEYLKRHGYRYEELNSGLYRVFLN